ncbi:enoyl-CoA hydratase [Azohydromonas caseinilytica]|uniref:Enoyl-CoA hydratase n=1 Tax=Azohydromonas caseinilytica TaxID=2728836 RepID=A0A848F102_9BURK|nr:enoyl-CoA hydratase [Azohydromonas caseinilytica]NML13374.1 enoyl-CoA hydratase [Azohydromonas caseinilytica]
MSIRTANVDGVATLEIARPEKKNALTQAMYAALAQAVQAAQADPAVRAVLITGQPGIFTSGNDLEDFLQHPPGAEDAPVFAFMESLLDLDKPLVAAVTGAAIGIGCTMLLHCDLVVVCDEAKLALPFVNLGLVPEFGSSLLLAQRIGHVRAAEKLMLGDAFTGAEAVELGLANVVMPPGEVLAQARRMAMRFTQLPPEAVRQTKSLMRAPVLPALRQALQAERELFVQRLRSPEAKEAFQAFFEKRRPDFSKF